MVPILKPILKKAAPDNQSRVPRNAPFEATKSVVSAAPLVFAPWPRRAEYSRQTMAWERFHDGETWKHCGSQHQSTVHWYCLHLDTEYMEAMLEAYDVCEAPMGIFDRADVRLVLDIGGGTGAFAAGLFRRHGDRILTITGQLYAAENDGRYNHKVFPLTGFPAARGFPGVIIDMFGFFPFGESALDVVHTSWTYHGGFPNEVLFEIHRVLRPGGYFILRMTPTFTRFMQNLRQFAASQGWVVLADKDHCRAGFMRGHSHANASDFAKTDTVMAFRMPLSPSWIARTYDA